MRRSRGAVCPLSGGPRVRRLDLDERQNRHRRQEFFDRGGGGDQRWKIRRGGRRRRNAPLDRAAHADDQSERPDGDPRADRFPYARDVGRAELGRRTALGIYPISGGGPQTDRGGGRNEARRQLDRGRGGMGGG